MSYRKRRYQCISKHSCKTITITSNIAKHLPEVLCIDEFKGNTGNYKYQVSLMDGKTRKPIDIIECRYKTDLLDYFNKFSLNEQKSKICSNRFMENIQILKQEYY